MTTRGMRHHLLGDLHPWVHFLHRGDGIPLVPLLTLLLLATSSLDEKVTKSIEFHFITDQMHQCQGCYQ